MYLASASHEKYVRAVADHLGDFDGWFASNDEINLSGSKKRDILIDFFGDRNYSKDIAEKKAP